MSEYDPSHLAEQNLYGSSREGQGYGGGGGGGGSYHRRHGSNGGGGGGGGGWGHRSRGPRRSGGQGWNGGGEHHGGGGYHRGGGGGRERDVMDAEEFNRRRLRDALFRLGDTREGATENFHPPSELYRMKDFVEREAQQSEPSYQATLSAFKVMATEQPHKTPLVAALLGFLVLTSSSTGAASTAAETENNQVKTGWEEAEGNEEVQRRHANVGIQLVQDLITIFRQDLDARLWRNVRLLMHLFAALIPLSIVRASSVRAMLASFAAVLEEPGVTAARGDRAAICIIETMCRAGTDLILGDQDNDAALTELDDLVSRVQRYAHEYRHVEVALVQPFALLKPDAKSDEEEWIHEESFESSVDALQEFRARGYQRIASLPSAIDLLPPAVLESARIARENAISLPDVLVPPDDESTVGALPMQSTNSKATARQPRPPKGASVNTDEQARYRASAGVERIYRYPKWFKDSVPDPKTPESVVLRSLMHEVIDLYQVNRKEAAKILLDLPRWHRKGTFMGRNVTPDMGIFGDADESWHVSADDKLLGGWNIDELIVECILSASLILPLPPQKPIYYTSLLREVVALAPQSIAPAMGKSVRRVYGLLGSGRADAEAIRRFADWFSVHLSNFNFGWNWKEWIGDTPLSDSHPKIAFARRIIELEVRLAYHERIKQTLPDEIQQRLLPLVEPSPTFTYASDDHPFRERSASLMQSMRARATAEVILAELQSFTQQITPSTKTSFVPSDDESSGFKAKDADEASLIACDVTIQAILSLGSRSFSHFLNVVERYHGLLRQLSSSPDMRLAILSSTTRFWTQAPQWMLIVTDKWLQYRIVEPTDVIDFVFSSNEPKALPTLPSTIVGDNDVSSRRDWSHFTWWELIKLTVYKVHGRVDQVRKRLEVMQREDTERLERLEAVREAGGSTEAQQQGQNGEENGAPKPFVFPSGATVSTLPRRQDLPSLDSDGENGAAAAAAKLAQGAGVEKKQTLDEVKASYDNIAQEHRKVLIRALSGFVACLAAAPEHVWHRSRQEDNDEPMWQLWWIKSWYVEFCRLFNKDLMAHHETIVANVFATIAEKEPVRDVFERSCQMATE